MTSRADRCPLPVELERSFWTADPDVRVHAESCERCGDAWAEIGALSGARARLEPAASPAGRRDELRTMVMASMTAPVASARRRSWRVLAPLAAAAAILLWLASPRRSDHAGAQLTTMTVLDHGGAHYLRSGTGSDEIVRLTEGSLSVAAADRAPEQRLRVITGDAELDGAGAAFDVSVEDDRLVSVRVLRGAVVLRHAGGAAPVQIHAGELWSAPEVAVVLVEHTPVVAPQAASPIVEPSPRSPRLEPEGRRVAPVDAVDDPVDPPLSEPATLAEEQIEAQLQPPAVARARSAGQQAFDDGWAAVRAGDFVEAATAFERAESGSDRAVIEDAAYWRAIALARAGRSEAAERAFEHFLAEYPASVRAGEASVMLGWILFQRGDTATAEVRFRAAVRDRSADVRRSAGEGLAAVRKK